MRKRSSIPEYDRSLAVGSRPFEGDRQFVGALYRGLEVLRAFRLGDDSLSNAEIAQRTGLGNSTISRLTYTLSMLGYLKYDTKTGRYRLGVGVLGLGYACLAGFPLRETAQQHMQEMADKAGGGLLIALSTRDDLHMTYIACARSREGVMSLRLNVGSRISLPRSSSGRAYLATIPEEERTEILDAVEANTPADDWPMLKAHIEEGMAQVWERGYCLNLGQWRPEVNTAAVPVQSMEDESSVYAISCGGPAYLLGKERLEKDIAPLLLELREKITRA